MEVAISVKITVSINFTITIIYSENYNISNNMVTAVPIDNNIRFIFFFDFYVCSA